MRTAQNGLGEKQGFEPTAGPIPFPATGCCKNAAINGGMQLVIQTSLVSRQHQLNLVPGGDAEIQGYGTNLLRHGGDVGTAKFNTKDLRQWCI